MTKIDIISGFLGAGKTTLINKLLLEAYLDEKPVLIENEFGEASIDDILLEDADIHIKLLASGCICCTVKGDFIKGITEVVETYAPSRILIEPSGLADRGDILDACEQASQSVGLELNALITVVDARNLLPLICVAGDFFLDQISQAKTIVLSNTQNMEPSELADVLDALNDLNPSCQVFSQPWDSLEALSLMLLSEEANVGEESHHHHNHGARDYTSLSYYPTRKYRISEIEALLSALSSGKQGLILRVKGLLNSESDMKLVEYVYGTSTIRETSYTGDPKLVIIGQNLDHDALDELIGGLK